MEDFLIFLMLVDALELLERQSIVIDKLAAQRDQALEIAKQANRVTELALERAGI